MQKDERKWFIFLWWQTTWWLEFSMSMSLVATEKGLPLLALTINNSWRSCKIIELWLKLGCVGIHHPCLEGNPRKRFQEPECEERTLNEGIWTEFQNYINVISSWHLMRVWVIINLVLVIELNKHSVLAYFVSHPRHMQQHSCCTH